MITYSNDTKAATLINIKTIGWCLTKKTNPGGFKILALENYGKGWETREKARTALKILKS